MSVNNPTAQQFTAAYKRLLLRSSIGGGKGNCQKRDPTDILYLLSDTFINEFSRLYSQTNDFLFPDIVLFSSCGTEV